MPNQDEGLGHKLLSLLPIPRHATFRVRLTIHEVTNVPLLRGNFAVRWKFKNVVHSHSSWGDVSRASTPSSVSFSMGKEENGKAAGSLPDNDRKLTRADKGKGKALESPVDSTASVLDSTDVTPTAPNGSPPSPTRAANPKYGHFLSPEPPPSTPPLPTARPGPDPVKSTDPGDPNPSSGDTSNDSQSKGSTVYVSLKDHAVRWERSIETMVEMKVRRDTGDLLPAEFRLVIQEAFLPPDVPQVNNGRLGVVLINLAEYADPSLGPVSRRYLLRESKSNATLKLTIHLTHLTGEKHFKAPPLNSGQAVAGVAGVLASDHFRSFMQFDPSRPSLRPLPSSSNSRADSSRTPTPKPNGLSGPGAFTPLPTSSTPQSSIRHKNTRSSESFQGRFISDPNLHSAETVIEAIFNPFPSTSTTPSPFTYYAPPSHPSPPPRELPLDCEDAKTMDSHTTRESQAPSGPLPEVGGKPPGSGVGWWRRLGGSHGSRPSTPPTTQPPHNYLKKRRPGSIDNPTPNGNHKDPKPLSRANSHKSKRSASSFVVVVETVA